MSSSFLAIATWIRSPGVESGGGEATLEGRQVGNHIGWWRFSVRFASNGGRDHDGGLSAEGCQARRSHDMAAERA